MTFNPPAAPAAPNTAQPATFQADADAFAAWMAAFGSAINSEGGLLQPGDFGLGVEAGSVQTFTLANALIQGMFRYSGSDPDAPFDLGREGVVLVFRTGGARIRQVAYEGSSEQNIYQRRSADEGATWSEWIRLNPDRGSNANGEYVRFADGTQICTFRGTSSASGDATWVFPSQFLTSAGLVVTATHTGSADNYNASVRAPTPTSCGFNVWDVAGARKTAGVSLMAVGRWY